MAGLPKNFEAISNVLPTYDFVDIIAGTGYVNFYAGNTFDIVLLSNFTYYSDVVFKSAATTNLAYTKVLDLDFDVTLNRPIDLQGKGIVNIPIWVSDKCWGYVVVTLRKYDGVTETDIISNTSRADAHGTSAAGVYTMLSNDLDIPLTHYKKGEILRLTIEGWAKSDDASSATLKIGNDPLNRSTTWDTTGAIPSQLKFQCPVRLNL